MTAHRPPQLAKRWLQRSLDSSVESATILGDLEEDFHREVLSRGPDGAARWYWWEVTRLVSDLKVRRAARVLTGRSKRHGEGSFGAEDTGHRLITKGRPGMLGILLDAGWKEDGRYALRTMMRDVRFYGFAVAIMGLAIGASTAVYSVMAPLVLRPLDFHEPDRLVWISNDGDGGLSSVTSRAGNLRDFRLMSQTLESIGGFNAFFDYSSYNLFGDGDPTVISGVGVTHDFLDILGVSPAMGRNFLAEEAQEFSLQSIILSHRFWVQQYGADPDILGKTLNIDDAAAQVVGVLPPDFSFSDFFAPSTAVEFLRPFPISDQTDQWGNSLSMVGRLRPGATAEAAHMELVAITERLQAEQPDRWGLGVRATSLQEHLAKDYKTSLLTLAAGAAVVFLIACANLSNLMLARGPKRRKEMAVRSAMGASQVRLTRQLLLESLLVSLGGGALGIAIATIVTRGVAASSAFSIPMLSSVSVDGAALLFTLTVAVVAGLLVGVVPAFQGSSGAEARVIREDSRSGLESRRSARLRETLVIAEVALACVLLVGGGLLFRSLANVMDVNLGYQPAGAMSWRLNTPNFDSLPQASAYFDAALQRIREVPGVGSVGITDTAPLGRNRSWGGRAQGTADDSPDSYQTMYPRIVSPGYIETMEIPLLQGRAIDGNDRNDSEYVGMINESAARALFPGQDPVGQFVETGGGTAFQVVGVVGDVRHLALEEESGAEMYLPMTQWWWNGVEMVIRSDLPRSVLIQNIRGALGEFDPTMASDDYRTLGAVVDRAVSPRRFTLNLLGAFAASALLLAALGIYGVLSYSVSQRIPEIGVRMALGESRAGVMKRVVGRTLMLSATGVILGAIAATATGKVIASLLFGVAPTDILTFVGVGALLLGVAGLAGYLPARRASRTDPAKAFRSA